MADLREQSLFTIRTLLSKFGHNETEINRLRFNCFKKLSYRLIIDTSGIILRQMLPHIYTKEYEEYEKKREKKEEKGQKKGTEVITSSNS